jgi:hypothetical protein
MTSLPAIGRSKSPPLTDWSPMAGWRVANRGETDADGARYPSQIAAILVALRPADDVHNIRLPGLADGDDIEHWADTSRRAGLTDT